MIRRGPSQKISLSPSWMMRASAAPLIVPNCGVDTFVFGFDRFTLLKALNISQRI